MFSWRDTRWYWLIRYTDLKSISKPPWYLRSSHHLRSQSQLKLVLLEEEQVISNLFQANMIYTMSISSGHDLSKFDSNLVEVWRFCNIVIFCLLFVFKSSSGHTVPFPQFELKSHEPEGLVMRRPIFNIYFGQRQRYDWSWFAAIAAPVIALIHPQSQLGLPPKLLLEEESENKQVQCSKTLFMLISKYLSKYL